MVGWTRRNREYCGRYVDSKSARREAFWVIAIVTVILIALSYDGMFLEEIKTRGTISGKIFVPGHRAQTSTGFMYDVRGAYIWVVSFDGLLGYSYVGGKYYNTARVGDRVRIVYRRSRVFSRTNILSCYL